MLADFGELVVFTPGAVYPNRSDKTKTIKGIFDNAYYRVDGEPAGINTRESSLICRTADTEDAARNSMVEVDAGVFKVTNVEPDGTGVTVLVLEGPR